MAMSISEGGATNLFSATLGAIWTSVIENTTPAWKGYLDEKSTDKRYYDDVEFVDPELWSETEEGSEIDLGEYSEGIVTRYRPLKFAKKLVIPEEIEEDCAHEEAYNATRMLARTCIQTQDYYAVSIIDDAASSGVVGGDGVCLGSASHVIKGGGTVSNILSPALTPSNTALQLFFINTAKMKGGNGYIAGVKIKKFFGPEDWRFRFAEILKSELRDDTSNNATNALKGTGVMEYASIPHMASTTNYGAKTNVDRGASFVWRRKPRFKKDASITVEATTHVGSARWVVNWSNWRTYYFSFA
jgi:hypothetical protein